MPPPAILTGTIVGLPKSVQSRFEIPLSTMVFSTGLEQFIFNTASLPGNRNLTAINYIWVDASELVNGSDPTVATSIEIILGQNYGLAFASGTQGFYPLVTTMPFNCTIISGDNLTRGKLNITLLNTDEEIALAWGEGFGGGGGGGGATLVWNPTVSGTADGTNPTFTLAGAGPSNGAIILVNGVEQQPGASADYTISGTTITFNAGSIPPNGAIVSCSMYQ